MIMVKDIEKKVNAFNLKMAGRPITLILDRERWVLHIRAGGVSANYWLTMQEFQEIIGEYFEIKKMIEEHEVQQLNGRTYAWLENEQKTLKKVEGEVAQYFATSGDAKITVKCNFTIEVEFDFDGLNYPIYPKNLDEVKTCVEFFKLLQ